MSCSDLVWLSSDRDICHLPAGSQRFFLCICGSTHSRTLMFSVKRSNVAPRIHQKAPSHWREGAQARESDQNKSGAGDSCNVLSSREIPTSDEEDARRRAAALYLRDNVLNTGAPSATRTWPSQLLKLRLGISPQISDHSPKR